MMAFSSTTYFPILLLLILFSFLHVHARDGQFFSKISTNNNAKETTDQLLIPNKQEAPLNKQEQDPNFIPQNQQNTGYGLYGHESGQFPPATTSTGNLPYKTESEESYNKEYYPNSNTNKENRQYYNNDAYFTDPQGMSDTRFVEKAYTSPITSSSNNNNNYYNGGNMYNSRQQGMGASKFSATNYGNKYNNGGNMYNYDKPAGMSDTRFLENGRYYYDLNSENYNLNANENSRGFESRNEYYNNRGYYGNNGNSLGSSDYYNNRGQYANNENSYEVNNSMEGYNQNQEEFQESQDEQFMP